MSDMHQSGVTVFKGWHGTMRKFWSRWLGDFNPSMPAKEANRILHEGRITAEGQAAFARGWEAAQTELRNTPPK